jgi:hypothetical protein
MLSFLWRIQDFSPDAIGKSKMVKRKFQGFSGAFWFGLGLIYQEMGIWRRSTIKSGCEKRFHCG